LIAPATDPSKIPPMVVKINIIKENLHSPSFVALPNGDNWCGKTYSVNENTYFSIDVSFSQIKLLPLTIQRCIKPFILND
jgi:hypothetical protein